MNTPQSIAQNTIYDQEFRNYQNSKLPESKFYESYVLYSAPDDAVVVFPILTQSAYQWDGIHDFYRGYCSDCITAPINNHYQASYGVGGNAFRILEFLGYSVIDDLDIDQNPEILQNYDKIVLLHNEFVTKKEFDAITNHENVVYLYPNSLSSKVEIDYMAHEMTLTRGPGFPESDIKNGFDWKNDNTEFLWNLECDSWEFYSIDNGHMLDCYPEHIIVDEKSLLQRIKEI